MEVFIFCKVCKIVTYHRLLGRDIIREVTMKLCRFSNCFILQSKLNSATVLYSISIKYCMICITEQTKFRRHNNAGVAVIVLKFENLR